MLASNRKAAADDGGLSTLRSRPDSRLFHGRSVLPGRLDRPRGARARRVSEGDLSGIAAEELAPFLRPYTFPPLELALEPDWDRKLRVLAERSCREPITLVGGVPSWLLVLFQRVLDLTGKARSPRSGPTSRWSSTAASSSTPTASRSDRSWAPAIRLQETYPCSEGFIAFGDPRTGLLRLVFDHGLFYEFVPVDELDLASADAALAGNCAEPA